MCFFKPPGRKKNFMTQLRPDLKLEDFKPLYKYRCPDYIQLFKAEEGTPVFMRCGCSISNFSNFVVHKKEASMGFWAPYGRDMCWMCASCHSNLVNIGKKKPEKDELFNF